MIIMSIAPLKISEVKMKKNKSKTKLFNKKFPYFLFLSAFLISKNRFPYFQ
jgi:hypothetical protein